MHKIFLFKRKSKNGTLNNNTVNNLDECERSVLKKGSGQLNTDGSSNILLKNKPPDISRNLTTNQSGFVEEERAGEGRSGNSTNAKKQSSNSNFLYIKGTKKIKGNSSHEHGAHPPMRNTTDSMTETQKITEIKIPESVVTQTGKRAMKEKTTQNNEIEIDGKKETSPKKTKPTQAKKQPKRIEYTVKFLKSNVSDRTWLITPDERKTYRTLDLRKAKLSHIPPSVLQLRGFQAVRLSCNEELTSVRELGHMGSLKIVDLKNCGIKTFCDTGIGLNKLKALELSNNEGLSDFGDIKTLPHLQHLSLAGCSLCTVPHEIYDIARLQVLVLDNNPLDQARFDITILTELQVLLVSNCGFVSLPRSIGLLQELMYLSIANNDIKELPNSLMELPTLKVINAYGNCGFSFTKPIHPGSLLKKLQVDEEFKLDLVHKKARKVIEVWRKPPTAWWKHV